MHCMQLVSQVYIGYVWACVCVCVCGEETVPGNIKPPFLKQTLTVEQSQFNSAQRQQGNNAHQ